MRANEGRSGYAGACSNCAIGAHHAGRDGANLAPLAGRRICARCHVGTPRLIRGHLCPSCYNRERELRVGRNGKGRQPIKARAALAPRSLDFVVGARWVHAERDLAADRLELMVAALCGSPERVRFAARPPLAIGAQGRLW